MERYRIMLVEVATEFLLLEMMEESDLISIRPPQQIPVLYIFDPLKSANPLRRNQLHPNLLTYVLTVMKRTYSFSGSVYHLNGTQNDSENTCAEVHRHLARNKKRATSSLDTINPINVILSSWISYSSS